MQSVTAASLSEQAVAAVKQTCQVENGPIFLHEPVFEGNEWKYVKECLDTGWVSTAGSYVSEFEKKLAEYTGLGGVIATINGTSALHMALKVIDLKENDEVLLPAFSFVAPANAVKYCHAIPHFVDCESVSFGMDPVKLEEYLKRIAVKRGDACYNRTTNRRIKALLVVHIFGHPSQMDALAAIAKEYRMVLIEDAAEALGAYI